MFSFVKEEWSQASSRQVIGLGAKPDYQLPEGT